MIVLDTNALMMPVECDVRVFEELERLLGERFTRSATERPSSAERSSADHSSGQGPREDGDEPRGFDPVVPEAVLDELERLSDGAGEEATAASVGLDLARERCRAISHEATNADDAVLECARRDEATGAVTNDMPLRRRLLDANVPVLSLRGNDKLTVTQP